MSIVKATIYDKTTGEIIMSVEGPDEETVHLQGIPENAAISWGSIEDHATTYFVKGKPVPRPLMHLNIVSGTQLIPGELLIINNLPPECTVGHPAGESVITDGSVSWSTLEEGTYRFTFKSYPYVEEKINVIIRPV